MNYQITRNKNQINSKSKKFNFQNIFNILSIRISGHCDLFEICDSFFGISVISSLCPKFWVLPRNDAIFGFIKGEGVGFAATFSSPPTFFAVIAKEVRLKQSVIYSLCPIINVVSPANNRFFSSRRRRDLVKGKISPRSSSK